MSALVARCSLRIGLAMAASTVSVAADLPATVPSTQAATRPAVRAGYWTLKPGAPKELQTIVDDQPQLRAKVLDELFGEDSRARDRYAAQFRRAEAVAASRDDANRRMQALRERRAAIGALRDQIEQHEIPAIPHDRLVPVITRVSIVRLDITQATVKEVLDARTLVATVEHVFTFRPVPHEERGPRRPLVWIDSVPVLRTQDVKIRAIDTANLKPGDPLTLGTYFIQRPADEPTGTLRRPPQLQPFEPRDWFEWVPPSVATTEPASPPR